jgi:hypothetical protein
MKDKANYDLVSKGYSSETSFQQESKHMIDPPYHQSIRHSLFSS